ncbi:threonine dehydratase biosynthetic [Dinoroseobacter shibae DFL 12 = DSM 16493]|jgi:threonine dehydratase|uniref:L-threonine dehydratase n=1 Tax=Dinoroseobacter shibae (strain DSM 16493 / NCIMB 14021 / DFL 12) TaxID=398580 RepID=A8LPE1_DINSH|nr:MULTISPECIES: threonine ammonia-lyase IlvA [Dinoroseobacter]ABV95206.1 threonine dehydratase biosynthetic [Dinoroseobacter shibae DFL 12 = DSM 16493]MDD9718075.1 threonine ammonia-lyase IlvA [Dinoroseobacter sp. PD6]URF46619.1 threonine ammonia-lyase IlvA [Dinoroseobacter shibae]URF50925.1 threonine ammonia-lyase IlvA [Dinoroseobacter shibae]
MTEFADNAHRAASAMRPLFPATPLQMNIHLSERYGAEIWLKREDLSPVRSYKIRGAFNAISKRVAEGQTQFACASAGNHAQGVAYACQHFGVHGVIFMPVTTPRQKIDKTRIFGGTAIDIELVGDYFDDTLAAAQRYCTEASATFLSPFDDADVIEGQSTVAVELLEQLEGPPDMVILPVGGGGLSSGMKRYFEVCGVQVDLRLVEPCGARSLAKALETGAPQTLSKVDNFVDGAAVARIGARPFEILRDVPPDHVLGAPEDRICHTMLEMLNVEGIVLEPAGALAVDVLDTLRDSITGKRVVCVTSGGNFDFERLPEVKERSLRYAGLKKYFILRLPQRPGALKEFLGFLGPDDDIARFEYLKKSARNFGSVLIGIETKDAGAFEQLFARLDAAGFPFRDITEDALLAEFLI